MLLALLLEETFTLPWDKLLAGAQGVLVLTIILIFFLRIAPTWKEVKMREFDARHAEAVASGQQSESLKVIADLLYKATIEQRRAADSVKILQHSNSRDIDNYAEQLSVIEERVSAVENQVAHAA